MARYNRKLTPEQVAYIRANYQPYVRGEFSNTGLAKKFGVNRKTIGEAYSKKRYSKVSGAARKTTNKRKKTFMPTKKMPKRPHSNECPFNCPVCSMGVHGTFPGTKGYGKPFRNMAEANRCCSR